VNKLLSYTTGYVVCWKITAVSTFLVQSSFLMSVSECGCELCWVSSDISFLRILQLVLLIGDFMVFKYRRVMNTENVQAPEMWRTVLVQVVLAAPRPLFLPCSLHVQQENIHSYVFATSGQLQRWFMQVAQLNCQAWCSSVDELRMCGADSWTTDLCLCPAVVDILLVRDSCGQGHCWQRTSV